MLTLFVRFRLHLLNLLLTLSVLFSLMSIPVYSFSAAAGSSLSINPQPIWSVGDNQTHALAWGDVDNDGDLDLAIADINRYIRLYLNENGMLKIDPVWWSSEESWAQAIAWGDVNSDGYLDLVVATKDEPNRLYLNQSGVMIADAAWESNDTDDSKSLAWGDVNGDGRLDLAVGNDDDVVDKIYLNQDGTLETTATWQSNAAEDTKTIALVDVNNDGLLDLSASSLQGVRVYLNGDAGIPESSSWDYSERGVDPILTAWGDMDGDDFPELAIGGRYAYGTGDFNRIWSNLNGKLQTTPVWQDDDLPMREGNPRWADMDSDGDLDLIFGDYADDLLLIYENNGGVPSANPIWSSVEAGVPVRDVVDIEPADVDNDGDLDMLIANDSGNKLYRNDQPLLDQAATWSLNETASTSCIAHGDVNGDGYTDLVAAIRDGPAQIHFGGPAGESIVWNPAETNDIECLALGDVDGDHDLDLAAVYDDNPTRLFLNEGDALQPTPAWTAPEGDGSGGHLAWGDADGDGDLDLAVVNKNEPARVYFNAGGQLQAQWKSAEERNFTSVAWGDVDLDGDLDLAVGSRSYVSHLYLNQDGALQEHPIWRTPTEDITHSLLWADINSDGFLDLVTGNHNAPNKVYLNDEGKLPVHASWRSEEQDSTRSLVAVDVDHDGDVDIVAGNENGETQLYLNQNGSLIEEAVWSAAESNAGVAYVTAADWDNDGDPEAVVGDSQSIRIHRNRRYPKDRTQAVAPFALVTSPDPTPASSGHFSAHYVTGETVEIGFTLYAPAQTTVDRILAEYSINGGQQWEPATPAPNQTLVDLSASPDGMAHTFIWDASVDLVRSQQVSFRVRAVSSAGYSPLQWAAMGAASTRFNFTTPRYIRVVDQQRNSVKQAQVYHNGVALGVTDQAGLLSGKDLNTDAVLVAFSEQDEQASPRAEHGGWAYRTLLSSVPLLGEKTLQPLPVTEVGEQMLILNRQGPLVIFNLVISIEWDVTTEYLHEMTEAMKFASLYLYDLTDGQMTLGAVAVYDGKINWDAADIQVFADNSIRPYSTNNGINDSGIGRTIKVGRYWDRNGANQGRWNEPDGYRTLIHEFGHYALRAYDEYIRRQFDDQGNLIGTTNAACVSKKLRLGESGLPEESTGSAMYYQYTTTEFSARYAGEELWRPSCELTRQWDTKRESVWETWVGHFADTEHADSPRWTFITPAMRGGVWPGPDAWPSAFPRWPVVNTHVAEPAGETHSLQVLRSDGSPAHGAFVVLHKKQGMEVVQVIEQGYADDEGRITILGAAHNDEVRAVDYFNDLTGMTLVTQENTTITLR